jgi:hypothetical protein
MRDHLKLFSSACVERRIKCCISPHGRQTVARNGPTPHRRRARRRRVGEEHSDTQTEKQSERPGRSEGPSPFSVTADSQPDVGLTRERNRGREAERQRGRGAEGQRGREAERQRDRETERQRGRQTERQRERHRQRERDRRRQADRLATHASCRRHGAGVGTAVRCGQSCAISALKPTQWMAD